MKIPPEERPKAIMLALAIVAVLCMFGFTVVPRLLPHGPNGELLIGRGAAPAAATASTHPVATALPGAITASAAPSADGMAAPILTGSVNASDPFWTPLALSLQPPKANNISPRPPISASSGYLQSGKGKDGTGMATGNAGRLGTGAMRVPPPSMPDVELQGIVQDETSIAVLNIGGQARFVKVGESLEAGWSLARIQAGSVVLKQGPRLVVLNLGQTMLKETPTKEAPQEAQGGRGIADTLPAFQSIALHP